VIALVMAIAGWRLLSDRNGAGDGDGPPRTAAVVVDRYLDALQRRDEEAIVALAPPGYDAGDDVGDRLARYGGIRPGAQTSLTSDITPTVMTVRIRAIAAAGQQLRWTENLVRRQRGWYVLLGSRPTRAGERPSSSTTRP